MSHKWIIQKRFLPQRIATLCSDWSYKGAVTFTPSAPPVRLVSSKGDDADGLLDSELFMIAFQTLE
jgi:hypothetical protein